MVPVAIFFLCVLFASGSDEPACIAGTFVHQGGSKCIPCEFCGGIGECQHKSNCSTCISGTCPRGTTCISTPTASGFTTNMCSKCEEDQTDADIYSRLNDGSILLRCPSQGLRYTGAMSCDPVAATNCPVLIPCTVLSPKVATPRWSSKCEVDDVPPMTISVSNRECTEGDAKVGFQWHPPRFQLDCLNFVDCFSSKLGSSFRMEQDTTKGGALLQPPLVHVPLLVTLRGESTVQTCFMTEQNTSAITNASFATVREFVMEAPFFISAANFNCLLGREEDDAAGCDVSGFINSMKTGGPLQRLVLKVSNWFRDSISPDCLKTLLVKKVPHEDAKETCQRLRRQADRVSLVDPSFEAATVEPPRFTARSVAKTTHGGHRSHTMKSLSAPRNGCDGEHDVQTPCTVGVVSSCCLLDTTAMLPHKFTLRMSTVLDRAPGTYSLLHHVNTAQLAALGIHVTSLSGEQLTVVYPTTENITAISTAIFKSSVDLASSLSQPMAFEALAVESAVPVAIVVAQVEQESCEGARIVVVFDHPIAACVYNHQQLHLTAQLQDLVSGVKSEVQCEQMEFLSSTPNYALSSYHLDLMAMGSANTTTASCTITNPQPGTAASVVSVMLPSSVNHLVCTLSMGAPAVGSEWTLLLRNRTAMAIQAQLPETCIVPLTHSRDSGSGGCETRCLIGIVIGCLCFVGIVIGGFVYHQHQQRQMASEDGYNTRRSSYKTITELPPGSGGEINVRPLHGSSSNDPMAKRDWKREVWQHTYQIIEKDRQYINRKHQVVDMSFHAEDTAQVRHCKHSEMQQWIVDIIAREQAARDQAMRERPMQSQFFTDSGDKEASSGVDVDLQEPNHAGNASPPALIPPHHGGTTCSVEVINGDCIDVAVQMMRRDGLFPIVMDAASRMHFGGGYKNGASAQEEELCRRSNLGFMMDTALGYQQTSFFPLPAKDAIYIPKIKFFRLGPDHHYRTLDNPIECAVGAIAAHNKPPIEANGRMRKDEADDTRHMIETFLWMAKANNHDAVVLVALGCGAFQNPAEHVADLFATVLLDPRYRMVADGWFKRVVFAVLDDHNAKHQFNPEGNFSPFARMIKTRFHGTVETNRRGCAVDPEEVPELANAYEFWKKPGRIDKRSLPVRNACRYGAKCRDHSKTHRDKFDHPEDPSTLLDTARSPTVSSPPDVNQQGHCPFGPKCTRKRVSHWVECAHPPLCSNHTSSYPCQLNDQHHHLTYSHPPAEVVDDIREALMGIRVSPTPPIVVERSSSIDVLPGENTM